MKDSNSRQRRYAMSPFPEYELDPIPQSLAPAKPSRELIPIGQMMQGGSSIPSREETAPAMMLQQQMPQQYNQGYQDQPPTGKKILGIPKDQFIALMGAIASMAGPDSPAGRLGGGLINVAEMIRDERLGREEAQTAEAATRRKEADELAKEKRGVATTIAKEKRAAAAKVPSGWEAFYNEEKGKGQTAKQIWTDFKKIGGKKPALKTRTGTETIDGINYIGLWDNKGNFIPQRKLTKSEEIKRGLKPKLPAGEKSWAEKRARAKAAKESEEIILNPKYQNAKYQNEFQVEIDNFDRYSDKPYTYQLTPGKVVDWGRDIPPKVEKVDISTPEKIMESSLPDDMKRKLLLRRFPKRFE